MGQTMKKGDVYRFHYHPKEGVRDVNWCFDGQLVATEVRGELMLVDTYWGAGSENRHFTKEKAEAEGTLTFVCNLDEVVDIEHYDRHYWSPDDVFNLSRQHGCYTHFVRRKDAKRSKEAMLKALYDRLAEAKQKVSSAMSDVERCGSKIHEVETAADLNEVYI